MTKQKLKDDFFNPVFGGCRKYVVGALVGVASIAGCSGSSTEQETGKADTAMVYDTSPTWGTPESNPKDTVSPPQPGSPIQCYISSDGDKFGSSVPDGKYLSECPLGSANNKVDCDDNHYSEENYCPQNDADVSVGIDTPPNNLNNKNIVEIVAGYWHACARTSTNDVYCWGFNEQGQVGNETNDDQYLPKKVHGLAGYTITQLSAGAAYTCAIASTISEKGVVLCWGDNGLGQGGYELNIPNTNIPLRVKGLEGKVVTQVATGANHTLALIDNGSIYAFGSNKWGPAAGDGGIAIPTLVTGLEDKVVIDIAAGDKVSFAVTSKGEGLSWGGNFGGDLGYGEANIDTFIQNTPAQVKYLNGETIGGKVVTISTKMNSAFALLNTGKVVFWGNNQTGLALLGNNNFQNYLEPIVLEDLVDLVKDSEIPVSVTKISCGEGHAFFTRSDGLTGGGGFDGYGQLGTGGTNDVYSVGNVKWLYGGDQQVKQVAAGRDFTLILLEDGSLQSLGRNEHGERGTGTTDNVYFPTPVSFPID